MSRELDFGAVFDSIKETVAFLEGREYLRASLEAAGPAIFVVTGPFTPTIAYAIGMPDERADLARDDESFDRLEKTAKAVIARFHPTSSTYSCTDASDKEHAYVLVRTEKGHIVGMIGNFPRKAGTVLCYSVTRSHGLVSEERTLQCLERFCEELLKNDRAILRHVLEGPEFVE